MPSANQLTRRVLLVLFTVLTPLAGAADALAAEPAPPAGLRAEVYSGTAAELFWDRPAAFGLVYEVRRDGSVIATTDGVSFFDDTLAGGTAYTYAVIAIDREGGRSAPASVMFETRGGATAGPPAPTGLRAEVYSETAAELFWDRPDTFGLRYEVRRDGNVVTITDGVSFFDSSLAPGRSYAYRVIAIDRAGRRSAASTMRLTTRGDGGSGDDDSDATDGLVAPEIERIAVYSGTAAELFWQRPAAGSPVARVEVSRDNLVLGTTGGTSFFDDSRSPGVDYVYTLVAIDAEDRRSDGGAPEPGAGGDGQDTIRPDNAAALLAAVFDAYRGEPWGDIVFALPGYSRTPNAGEIGLNEERTLACDNGGTATIRYFFTGYGGGFGYAFDDCQHGETLFDGQVDNYQDRFSIYVVEGTGITAIGPTGTIRYAGHVREVRGGDIWWTREAVDFEWRAADGTLYSLSGADIGFQYGTTPRSLWPTIYLEGAFALTSDRTGGVTLRAETPETLGRPTGFDVSALRRPGLTEDDQASAVFAVPAGFGLAA